MTAFKNWRYRNAAILIIAIAISRVVLPRQAPGGVVAFGLVAGCVDALLAVGIVLVFRSSRVINFAQAAIGAYAGMLTFTLSTLISWAPPVAWLRFPLSLLVGVTAGVVVGALLELAFVRRFFSAPRLVVTVVTVVAARQLAELAREVPRLGFVTPSPATDQAISEGLMTTPFPQFSVSIYPFRFGFGASFVLIATLCVVGSLNLIFTRTGIGTRIRAAAENPDRALLLGVDVKLLSTVVWAVAGGIGAIAMIGRGMAFRFEDGLAAPQILLPALAAAILSRMRFNQAVVMALTIGYLRQAIFWSWPQSTATDLLLLVATVAGLLIQRNGLQRSEQVAAAWSATSELRPIPPQLRDLGVVRTARTWLRVSLALAVSIVPLVLSSAQTNLASLIAISTIVVLSVVVMTGWGAQVSLGQYAFVAIAAVVGGKLTSGLGISFWIALLPVCALTAGLAVAVGIPALRIKGSFLAVTTIAFAAAVQGTLFGSDAFAWLRPERVERPSLLFLSFGPERNYYMLCLVFAVLSALAVKRLRASRTGRIMIAVRENQESAAAFGVDPLRLKATVFAVSGALAGLGGMLLVHHQRAAEAASFGVSQSVDIFVVAMIGGVTSVLGAVLGAAYFGVVGFLISDPLVRSLATSGALLVLLVMAPGGLASIVTSWRDSLLRIVAARNRIAVPSLFADTDPEQILSRKAPLAPAAPGHGLEALDGQRWDLETRFHVRSK